MDVGIGLPATIRGATGAQIVEWARRAEARGFSSLGTIDRIVYGELRAADRAGRGRRGDGADPARDDDPDRAVPRSTARCWPSRRRRSTALSGGRLVLGVAVGGREDDYEASGVDFHAPRQGVRRACSSEWERDLGRRVVRHRGRDRPAAARPPDADHRRQRRRSVRSARRATATAGSWAAARPTSSAPGPEKLRGGVAGRRPRGRAAHAWRSPTSRSATRAERGRRTAYLARLLRLPGRRTPA